MIQSTRIAERAEEITRRERSRYLDMTSVSRRESARAHDVLPLGVASNFQYFEPHPAVMERSAGSRMWDVDGNEYMDFNMGYGALFAGHSHPRVVEAIHRQAELGTLYVTPTPVVADVANELHRRFALDMVRFTNSGTEATMDALRVARAYTGREKIVKVEGGYHGHHDLVMMSVKPPLDEAGPPDSPRTVPFYGGIARATAEQVVVVPYNDLEALEGVFAAHAGEIAAFILEPVPENMGIVLPDAGYLAGAAELCRQHSVLLVFDEVKTGITAGWSGASGLYGIRPDLTCLAKSIGGGVPIGAFGGRREIMAAIEGGRVAHQGTYNGNPLVVAACHAVLADVCTPEATAGATALNERLLQKCGEIIDRTGMPAHTVGLGAKGCITYSPTRVRNYRDYKQVDTILSRAHWIYMMTRGVFLPPGLDEQWLVSVLHTHADVDRHVEIFADFAEELTGLAT